VFWVEGTCDSFGRALQVMHIVLKGSPQNCREEGGRRKGMHVGIGLGALQEETEPAFSIKI
jgi:hypothetical protein